MSDVLVGQYDRVEDHGSLADRGVVSQHRDVGVQLTFLIKRPAEENSALYIVHVIRDNHCHV